MIDLKHLDKYVCGDATLRDEILEIFDEQAKILSEQISVNVPDDEWIDVVHKLKGAARGIGAWILGDVCEDAEGLTGEAPETADQRAAVMVSIRQHVAATRDEIHRLRDIAA